MHHQPSISAPVPAHAGFVFLARRHEADADDARAELAAAPHADHLIVGIGSSLLTSWNTTIPGHRPMPVLMGPSIAIPATPTDLFLRISGTDPGEVLFRERAVLAALPSFEVLDRVSGFMFADSRDLSGFVDGTENPTGDDADRVAFQTGDPGLEGSSIVAVQRWTHDLAVLDDMSTAAKSNAIGRDQHSNEELDDAPASAHVKRTAQEDFEPEAFVLRRSMPWRDERGAGLIFLSFAASLDPFEAQLRRMVGLDDGIVDALFGFTRPVTGGVYWCPPIRDGRTDLRAAG
jgi:putative iron-dependent peroxidase